jgi:hypothetical protein
LDVINQPETAEEENWTQPTNWKRRRTKLDTTNKQEMAEDESWPQPTNGKLPEKKIQRDHQGAPAKP